jgi:hypothetical protein
MVKVKGLNFKNLDYKNSNMLESSTQLATSTTIANLSKEQYISHATLLRMQVVGINAAVQQF